MGIWEAAWLSHLRSAEGGSHGTKEPGERKHWMESSGKFMERESWWPQKAEGGSHL